MLEEKKNILSISNQKLIIIFDKTTSYHYHWLEKKNTLKIKGISLYHWIQGRGWKFSCGCNVETFYASLFTALKNPLGRLIRFLTDIIMGKFKASIFATNISTIMEMSVKT